MIEDTSAKGDLGPPLEWDQVRPGQRVVAHQGAAVLHRGVVEETIPHLGVAWIRDATTGARKMLSRDDTTLRRGVIPPADTPVPEGSHG
ncbi:hypothetical protein ACH9EU_08710 [Kocuria sp. M1R5S2]|uniref:hypothetical protein n=1 Tax=Kocuria rhizosphaerae TaxID=3376285 RepID=UPI0037AA9B49